MAYIVKYNRYKVVLCESRSIGVSVEPLPGAQTPDPDLYVSTSSYPTKYSYTQASLAWINDAPPPGVHYLLCRRRRWRARGARTL